MKNVSGNSVIEKWVSLFAFILLFVLMTFNVAFFSIEFFIFFLFFFYMGWTIFTFYEVLICNNTIILKNSILLKEYVYKKDEFDFFERQNFSQSVHRICFKNGKKFYFHIYVMRYSPILPFGFTRKKDANIIYWEKWIKEMQD